MRPSIVQLEDYYFIETQIRLSPFFNPQKENQLDAEQIDCKIQTSYVEEKDFYFVELLFKIEPVKYKDVNIPYDIVLDVAGKVTVSPEYNQDKEHLAVINGASLLYSAIREHIIYLTSRYPFGSIIIPTIDLSNLKKMPLSKDK